MRAAGRRWPVLRLVLALLVLGVLGYAGLSHRTEAPLLGLYDDLRDGRVAEVRLAGGLPADAQGTAEQTVSWSTGYRRWEAELLVERPFGRAGDDAGERERTEDDVAARVRAIDPRVEVRTAQPPSGAAVEVGGTRLPALLAVPVGLAVLGGACLLLAGPAPLRATRWAWFWLLGVPGGALAFLALAGPTPGLRTPPPDAPRLSGGQGLGLALVLGLAVSALVALARRVLWPPHG